MEQAGAGLGVEVVGARRDSQRENGPGEGDEVSAIHLVVPGEPCGKGRPRFVRTTGHAFTPTKTVNAETQIRERFAAEYPGHVPFGGAVHMTVIAYFGVPASWPAKRKVAALNGETWLVKRPDGDNILKLCGDALNALAYHDDSQIVSASVQKAYAEVPRLEIVVVQMEEMAHGL